MTLDFKQIRGVVLDMDGVVWRGAHVLPGAPDIFHFLTSQEIPYILATNNSTLTLAEYVDKITTLGIPVTENNIVTSALVTIAAMKSKYPAGTPIYVIGSDSLVGTMTAHGYIVSPDHAQVVI